MTSKINLDPSSNPWPLKALNVIGFALFLMVCAAILMVCAAVYLMLMLTDGIAETDEKDHVGKLQIHDHLLDVYTYGNISRLV